MMPTAWDGRKVTKGKPNPVTLVATVVTRKMPVQPSSRLPATSPPAKAPGGQRDARREVVQGAGDGRVARPPLARSCGSAQPADRPEDSGARRCVGEVRPGTGRPFEGLPEHSGQQAHRHRGRRA